MFTTMDQESGLPVCDHIGNAAGIRCYYRQSGGKRLQNRKRLIVDVRSVQVDISLLVMLNDSVMLDSSNELRIAQSQVAGQLFKCRSLAAITNHHQFGLGKLRLNKRKSAEHMIDTVVRFQIAIR